MEAILLIGIQASGKSTFYQQYFADTHVLINLDTLKTRHREDVLLRACIHARQRFVVDNTNILAVERQRYIALAKPAHFKITGYCFQTSLQDALLRNQQRQGKAVIPEKGIKAKYYRMQPPRYEEGFDQLYSVTIDQSGKFIIQDWVK